MNVHKRYKMYKKGKKWCCMALTTFVAILEVLTTTEIANADIVTDPDQVALVSSTKTTIANENSSSADLNTTSENVPESGQKSDVSQAIFSSSKSASASSDNASNSSVENIYTFTIFYRYTI